MPKYVFSNLDMGCYILSLEEPITLKIILEDEYITDMCLVVYCVRILKSICADKHTRIKFSSKRPQLSQDIIKDISLVLQRSRDINNETKWGVSKTFLDDLITFILHLDTITIVELGKTPMERIHVV